MANIAEVGDINKDGYDDFLIADDKAYLIYGSNSLASFNTNNIALPSGIKIENIGSSNFRPKIAGIGNVNGDQFNDFIVTYPYATSNEQGYAGEGYVIYGSDSLANIDTASNNWNGIRIKGYIYYNFFGNVASGLRDVNRDGLKDFLISPLNSRVTYLFYGEFLTSYSEINLEEDDWNGAKIEDASIYVDSGIGDVNGDGSGDFITIGYDSGETAYLLFC